MAHIDQPVFVTGSPRTGTTLMQHCLSRDPQVYRLERESRFLWHRLGAYERTGAFPSRAAIERAYIEDLFIDPQPMDDRSLRRWVTRASTQGTPAAYWDLTPELRDEIQAGESWPMAGPFGGSEQDETAPFTIPPESCGWATDAQGPIRMVDKDTGHCWRLPRLAEAFPDATFVFMLRDPVHAITSLINAWLHRHWFFTYHVPEGLRIRGYSDEFEWGGSWWNLNLFPGWEELREASLAEVCARQWEAAVLPMATDGAALVAEGRARFVSFDRLVAEPGDVLTDLAELTGLDRDSVAGPGLSKVYMTMDPSTRIVAPDSPIVAEALEYVTESAALAASLTR